MSSLRKNVLGPLLLLAGVIGSAALAQESEQSQSEAEQEIGNCIRARLILRSHVLDDQSVVFEMRGGYSVLMRLKRRCPHLAFYEYFSYEPTMGQLCAEIDHIVTRAGSYCAIDSFSLYRPEEKAADGG